MTMVRVPDARHRTACVRHRLRDGGLADLRPLGDGEVAALATVFAGLSSRSRQQRFLVPMPRLTGAARRSLSSVNGHDHIAWVAQVDGVPVGIARCIRTSPDSAELAFEVVDAHQGRGIGSALVDAVTTVAGVLGVRWLEATVDPGNHTSAVVLARVGVRLVPHDGLLEGGGPLGLADPPRVDRTAVLVLAAQSVPRTASRAAATCSS